MDAEFAALNTDDPKLRINEKKISLNVAHCKLGHIGEDMARAVAKHLKIPLKRGNMKSCKACGVVKAKQKSAPKKSTHMPATDKEIRVYLDIASTKKRKDQKQQKKPHWRLIVDERTHLKFSKFFTTMIKLFRAFKSIVW